MKTVIMKNAYVEFPDEWLTLTNKDPKECEYCGVVQCRNNKKYKIPSFLFFLEKPICEMNAIDYENVQKACVDRFPLFEGVLNSQVDPVYDDNFLLKNLREWQESPEIEYFNIPDEGELIMDFGALVYRKKYEC